MRKIFLLSSAMVTLFFSNEVLAQSGSVNNNTSSGLYMKGTLGLNVLNDIEVIDGVEAKTEAGFLGALALGHSSAIGEANFRVEGELSGRFNGVEEVDIGGVATELDNADARSYAGTINTYLDFYVLPNFALTLGGGIGFANVTLDIVIVDDSATAFAYQSHIGGRYDLGASSTIGFGYTYFSTAGLELEDSTGDDVDINYDNHGFHLSYAYRF